MKDTVTPPIRAARVVAALQRLDHADMAVIERHAGLIHFAMLDLIAARRARGFDIGDNDGAHAWPRTSTVGPARELRDLDRLARKAIAGKISARQWTTAWAAQPERIKRLWKPKLIETPTGRSIDRSTLAMGFEAPGFIMLAPKPEVMLPAIKAELARITATPSTKTRKPNADEAAAIEAIRAAYRAITGHKGARVIRRGRLAGNLFALGREIDSIFGTTLFAVKDSRRLR
jgi:hypothetical protein